MSTVSVDADRRRVNWPMYTVADYMDVNMLGDSQAAHLRSSRPSQRGNVVGVDCGTSVVGGPASAVVLLDMQTLLGRSPLGWHPRPFLLVLSPPG